MDLKNMLSDRQLKICEELGCAPEEFAKAKMRRQASKLGLGSEVAEQAIQAIRAFERRRPASPQGRTTRSAHPRAGMSAVSSAPKGTVIAEVDVFGPIVQRSESYCGYIGYDAISGRICGELGKVEVGAVLVRIDSPGGDSAGIEEAISRIVSARDASGKPIAIYVDEYAASGGYWLASGIANAGIYAPRSGRVGGVGCWSMIVDERKALEQEGIAITVVRDPAGKDAANPYSPVADLALKRESQVVAEIANRFYSAVAAARKLTPGRVRSFDGAIFSAEKAKSLGLIDGIASYEEAIAILSKKAGATRNKLSA